MKNLNIKKLNSKIRVIDNNTTILVKPELLINFGYKYATNNIASTLMSAIEGTILSNSSLKHSFLDGFVITTTLQQKYAKNYKKVNKFIQEATIDQTGYRMPSKNEKGYAKGRTMNTDLLRFAGKKTYTIQYIILHKINKLKKSGLSLDETKKIIIDSKIFKKYIKKYNNYDSSRIVLDINKTASENKSLKKESIKIKSTKNLEKYIKDKIDFINDLEVKLEKTKNELDSNKEELNSLVCNNTSFDIFNKFNSLLFNYIDDLKHPDVKSHKRKPNYSYLIKRRKLIIDNIDSSVLDETIKLFNSINNSYTAIKELKKEIRKNKFLIKIAKSYIVDFERYGKVYYTNHFSELTDRDYNTIANVKKELRNILLEDYVEIDISNTAYTMFNIIAKSNNINVPAIEEYIKNRHKYLKYFGNNFKIDMLRLFNSDKRNKNKIKNSYPSAFHIFIDKLYEDLMKIRDFILKHRTFIFNDTIFTIQGNSKNILSLMYMKMESIIINKMISFGKSKKGFSYVRIHDAIFFNLKECSIELENLLNELLNNKIKII